MFRDELISIGVGFFLLVAILQGRLEYRKRYGDKTDITTPKASWFENCQLPNWEMKHVPVSDRLDVRASKPWCEDQIGQEPRFGPNLIGLGSKTTKDWLYSIVGYNCDQSYNCSI